MEQINCKQPIQKHTGSLGTKQSLLDCCTEVYLEEVLGDDVEPLGVVSDSLQTLVGQNNLKHLKEEVQRILVQEVHLKQVIESILSTCEHKI